MKLAEYTTDAFTFHADYVTCSMGEDDNIACTVSNIAWCDIAEQIANSDDDFVKAFIKEVRRIQRL